MPTYEYSCKACGEHFEIVQSFKDNALTECPACGGPLRKVFGNIGVAFKGSGFYKTDSRSDSHRGGHKAPESKPAEVAGSKSEGSKSEGGTTTKTEGAGAPKSEGSADSSKKGSASSGTDKSSGGSSTIAAAS